MSIKSKKIITKQLIKEHFDKLASDRESWIKKSKGFYFEDIKAMQEFIPEGSSILEIGCGNGYLLGALNPLSGVGIDISSEMILEAKKKYENLNFIIADIEDTNFIKGIEQTFGFIIISAVEYVLFL